MTKKPKSAIDPIKSSVTTTEARRAFGEVLDRVMRGERLVLESHGRPKAVIVPMEDLHLLEWADDLQDGLAVREALDEGGKPTALAEVRKELGLDDLRGAAGSPGKKGTRKAARRRPASRGRRAR